MSPETRRHGRSRLVARSGKVHVEPRSEAVLRMLRARAEDGRIEIANPAVESFIADALRRILGEVAQS